MKISWQVQHFNVHVQILWQVQHSTLRTPMQIPWRVQHFVNIHADFVAGTALCAPPCADVVAGAIQNALLCGEIANVRNSVFFNRTGGSEAGKSRKENWRLSSTGDILLVHGNGLLKFACIHEGHSKDYYVEDSWRTFLQ